MLEKDSNKSVCCYCGKLLKGSGSKEHIIPRKFGVGQYQGPSLQIRTCKDCNSLKSTFDEKVRDLLVADIGASGSQQAREILATKLPRAIVQRQKIGHRHHLQNLMSGSFASGRVYDNNGIVHEVDIYHESENIVWTWMTAVITALSLVMHNVYVPDNTHIAFHRLMPGEARHFSTKLNGLGASSWTQVGKNCLVCSLSHPEFPKLDRLWMLEVYDGVHFLIATGSIAGLQIFESRQEIKRPFFKGRSRPKNQKVLAG